MDDGCLGWMVDMLFVLITQREKATVHPVPSCQLSRLLANLQLLSD